MMRLARRTSLLIVLCLLTSAATAYAECAWVLWSAGSGFESGNTPSPLAALTTKAECEARLNQEANALVGDMPGVKSFRDRDMVAVTVDGRGVRTFRFTCLPDTVNPREAEGGGR
jgi:hypothetical protein